MQGRLRARATLSPRSSRASLTFGVLSSGCEQKVLDFLNFARLQHKAKRINCRDTLFWEWSSPPAPLGAPETLAQAPLPSPLAPQPRKGPRQGSYSPWRRGAESAAGTCGKTSVSVHGTREPAANPLPLPAPPKCRPHRTPSSSPRTSDPGPGSPDVTRPWIATDYPPLPIGRQILNRCATTKVRSPSVDSLKYLCGLHCVSFLCVFWRGGLLFKCVVISGYSCFIG